jgi:hypothetical protein
LIANSIKTLIHNEELRRKLEVNAYHTAYEFFTYENCVKTIKMLEESIKL